MKGINTNFVEDDRVLVAMFGTWVSAVLALCFRFDSVINNIVYLGQFNTAYRIFMCVYNDPYNGLLPTANMA